MFILLAGTVILILKNPVFSSAHFFNHCLVQNCLLENVVAATSNIYSMIESDFRMIRFLRKKLVPECSFFSLLTDSYISTMADTSIIDYLKAVGNN